MAGRFGQGISAEASRGGTAAAATAEALVRLVRLLAQQAARETLEADQPRPGGKEDSDA